MQEVLWFCTSIDFIVSDCMDNMGKPYCKKNQIDADSIYGFLGSFNEVYSECTDADEMVQDK